MAISKKKSEFESRIDYDKIQVGIVKQNNLPYDRNGTIKVWIKGSEDDPADDSTWVSAFYATPFGGATPLADVGESIENFEQTQKSYGMWFIPPDLDNEVMIAFINGNKAQCYWFACIIPQDMNHMVPGIGWSETFQGENKTYPAAEYNKKQTQAYDPNHEPKRPYYEPLTIGLKKQGLDADEIRGAGTSTARRESPSRVYGWSTPRGNQLIFDDGINPADEGRTEYGKNPASASEIATGEPAGWRSSEKIRLRTRSGTQILLDETTGKVYMNTRDGEVWMELSNDGHLDVYAARSINIRCEQNLNIRADKDINIDAGGSINMRAEKGNMMLWSKERMDMKTEGPIHQQSGQTIHQLAKNRVLVWGDKIYLNSNSNKPEPASIPPIMTQHNRVRPQGSGNSNAPFDERFGYNYWDSFGYLNGSGVSSLDELVTWSQDYKLTIVTRMPTHEPWVRPYKTL